MPTNKIVFWTVHERGPGSYTIRYWTKPDRSNSLQVRMVTLDEAKLRVQIERQIGLKHFTLSFVKGPVK